MAKAASESIEALADRIRAGVPGARVEVVMNGAPSAQHSLLVDRASVERVARFLRDEPGLQLDYCSNVTGVDWLDRTSKVRQAGEDGEKEVTVVTPGYLEVVYHLYSMALETGPVILRVRTGNRTEDVAVPSLTPVWRSCELQEREIYDLFGVRFTGHPDLRRLLMWEGFQDHPMRKDYVEPDDYEYEPTPHDRVLERARAHKEGGDGP